MDMVIDRIAMEGQYLGMNIEKTLIPPSNFDIANEIESYIDDGILEDIKNTLSEQRDELDDILNEEFDRAPSASSLIDALDMNILRFNISKISIGEELENVEFFVLDNVKEQLDNLLGDSELGETPVIIELEMFCGIHREDIEMG